VSVLTSGRVVYRAAGESKGAPAPAVMMDLVSEGGRRRIARAEVEAHVEAERIVLDAKERADALLARARDEALGVADRAATEARAAEHAKVAALYLALRTEQERRAELDLDRAVALAVVLAERLLGEALEQRPEHIAALARQALAEAGGARRAVIEAHPLDEGALKSHLVNLGMGEGSVEVRVSPELSRGSLLVHTNLGTLDAKLSPQLERLAAAVREALKPA
jgi:flagellar assembly protein FliH